MNQSSNLIKGFNDRKRRLIFIKAFYSCCVPFSAVCFPLCGQKRYWRSFCLFGWIREEPCPPSAHGEGAGGATKLVLVTSTVRTRCHGRDERQGHPCSSWWCREDAPLGTLGFFGYRILHNPPWCFWPWVPGDAAQSNFLCCSTFLQQLLISSTEKLQHLPCPCKLLCK